MDLPEGFEQKTVITFRHRDLEKLVYTTWQKNYDVGMGLDYPNNDSYYDYTVTEGGYEDEFMLDQGKEPAYENDIDGSFDYDRVIERLESGFWLCPGPADVLTALAENGTIPYGDYQLKYWW